jgi:hypothetical protein
MHFSLESDLDESKTSIFTDSSSALSDGFNFDVNADHISCSDDEGIFYLILGV